MDQFRPWEEQDPVRELQQGFQDAKAFLSQFLGGRGLWIAIAIIILIYLASGIYIVGPGEKGVVLLFGKVTSVTDSGPRYRLPKPFMSHVVVDIATIRAAEVGFRSERGRAARSIPTESLMLTGDENILDVQLFVQYVVQDPVKFAFGADSPEMALKVSAEVALRGVVGENTTDYTMTTGRMEIPKKVQIYLQKLLDAYDTGLIVTQASLLVVDPPQQVKEAFHDVVRAREDRERLIKEADGYREDVLPKARGQAQQEIREGEAYKAQRVIRAKGDVQRFISVFNEYAKSPQVTRDRLFLESAEQYLSHAKKFVLDGSTGQAAFPLIPLVTPDDDVLQLRKGKRSSESGTEKKGN